MRVVVPIVSSAHAISGVQRHAINMVQSLLLSEGVEHVHVVAGEWQQYVLEMLKEHPRLSIELVELRNDLVARNVWYGMALPRIARREGADLVHYSFPAPIRSTAIGVPVVLTLHDLYPYDLPENFGSVKAPFNRLILRQSLVAADAVACVSVSTQDRLERIHPLLALRSSCVIPNCVERLSADVQMPTWLKVDEAFVLCVAQHRRNKNLLLLLRAFVLLRETADYQSLMLIIVGMDGPETDSIRSFIREQRLQDNVILRRGLPDEELRWCYRHCLALVAPSVVEGFGLPVAEALMEGCRVVCSNIPAFREVGGSHCHYVHLGEGADGRFAQAIAEACDQPKPKAIGLPQYSRTVVGRQYEKLYYSLTSRSRGRQVAQEHSVQGRMEEQVQL